MALGVGLGQTARAAMGLSWSFVASLLRECDEATVHTARVCAGRSPEYYTMPGFGPITLAWGWGFMGLITGLFCGVFLMFLSQWCRRAAPPAPPEPQPGPPAPAPQPAPLAPAPQPAPPAPALQQMTLPEPVPPHEHAKFNIIRYIQAGGHPALSELAEHNGAASEIDFLYRLVGLQGPVAVPGPPGLQL